MNQPSKQLKAMAHRLFTAQPGVALVKTLHPKRDWMVGLLIGVCIATSIVGWSGYTYVVNRDGGTTNQEIEIANPTYQAGLVDQALTIFQTRAANFVNTGLPAVAPIAAPMVDPEIATTTATSSATTTINMENQEIQMETVVPPEEQEQISETPTQSW
jgi:hypothetical protein